MIIRLESIKIIIASPTYNIILFANATVYVVTAVAAIDNTDGFQTSTIGQFKYIPE